MEQSPFLGVYKTEDGQMIDAVSGTVVSASDIVPKMEPFYGKFLDAQGNEHDVSELFSGGGGGTGTTNHAALQNLSYETSGHTGFATAAQGALAETALQDVDKAAMISSVEYNPNTREILTTMGDGSSGATSTIPQASDTVNGLMTPADRASITELTSDVQSLKEGGVWREEFATYADLTTAYPALDVSATNWFVNDYVECLADESPTTTLHTQGQPSRYRVTVNADETVKTLVFQRDFLTGEAVNVQIATQTSLGVVKGKDVNGSIFIETDGTMAMVGYDDLVEEDVSKAKTLNFKVLNGNPLTATPMFSYQIPNPMIGFNTETGNLQYMEIDYTTTPPTISPYQNAGIVAGAMTPDYAKQETINRISTVNGTWVADRDGFVNVKVYTNNQGSSGLLLINGKIVAQGMYRLTAIAPVKTGDIVSIQTSGLDSVTCYFIPPIYQSPVIYGAIPDYSRMETTNRISTNNGTWVVENDGFVSCFLQATGTGWRRININNLEIDAAASYDNLRTILPVKAGDVVKIIAHPPTVFGTAYCYYIPIRALDDYEIPTKVIGNVLPDYGNAETTNRIATNNGTWTVADDGFVLVHAQSNTSNVQCFINDVMVLHDTGDSFNRFYDELPVKKGDVIRLYTPASFIAMSSPPLSPCGCYFIRPRHFDMDLMNSPHLWPDDGTEIEFADGSFGRRYTGTRTAAADVEDNYVISTISLANILSVGGSWQADIVTPIGSINSGIKASALYWLKNTGALYLCTRHIQTRTNAPYDVWLRYTK